MEENLVNVESGTAIVGFELVSGGRGFKGGFRNKRGSAFEPLEENWV
jgi:hypothetical protein